MNFDEKGYAQLLPQMTDGHAILTKQDLIDELFGQLDMRDKNILVVCTFEMVANLIKKQIEPSRIWFYTPCSKWKGALANEAGCHFINGRYEEFGEYKFEMKFDVVVGNPPYQGVNENDPPLWPQVVKKAFELINPNGKVAFITPPDWMQVKKNKKIDYSFFSKYQINEVHVFDKKTGDHFFPGVGSKFCWYIMTNEAANKPATLIQYESCAPTFIKQFEFTFDRPLPVNYSALSLAIHEKVITVDSALSGRRDCEFHSSKIKKAGLVNDTQTIDFQYKCYVSAVLTRYTKKKSSIFDSWKLMVGGTNLIKQAFVDNNCSVCEDIAYILMPNESCAKNGLQVFKSKLFLYLDKAYRHGRNLTHATIFPALDWERSWSDKEIYSFFGFTKEEINFIEAESQ